MKIPVDPRITVRLTQQDVKALLAIRDKLWDRGEHANQSTCVRHALRFTAMTMRRQ